MAWFTRCSCGWARDARECDDFSTMNTHQTQHTWLTGLLTGWGIKESWAKLIAGAVIGACAAAGLL